MTRYILRRLLIIIPVLLGVTIVVFILINLIPGDPAAFYVSPDLGSNPEQMAIVRERLGLNQPMPVRYAKWLAQTMTGDFGYRTKNGDPVGPVIWVRLQNTMLLAGLALLIGASIGIALGVFTAVRQYSIWDYWLTALSFLGIAMPAFIVGIFGLYVFALKIPLFPAGGISTVGKESSIFDTLYHAILPASLLSLNYLASFMRYTRFSLLEVLKQDYVSNARAKGLRESRIINVHALRNALLPVITAIGLSLPSLVVGAVFMETIFSRPGMGTLYLDAVMSRDYPLIMGMNLISASVILLTNLLTDITYAYVDPRIRYS